MQTISGNNALFRKHTEHIQAAKQKYVFYHAWFFNQHAISSIHGLKTRHPQCRCLHPNSIYTCDFIVIESILTIERGMSLGYVLRSPPLHHGLSYFRPSVLLISGSLTSRSLTVCVRCEHWTHAFTELPCGEELTNCWYAMVPLREVCLLLSWPSIGGCYLHCLWVLWSPLASGDQGLFD